MLSKLAEGKTGRWKRIWLFERGVAETVLHKPARLCVHLTVATLIGMLLANFFVVAIRFTPLAGSWPGAGFEVTELLMGIGAVLAIAYTWYEGGHLRITFFREKCGPRARAVLDTLAAFVFLIWFVTVTWGMWLVAEDFLWRGSRTQQLKILIAPVMFGFCIVAGHFVLVLLRSFFGSARRAARRKRGRS